MSETPTPETLFDEFAVEYLAGRDPDTAAYLARAGVDAGELARLIDVFVRVAPAPEPSEEAVAVMRERLEGQPGLITLRHRRRLTVDDVVAPLTAALGFAGSEARVKRHYQRLEGAVLDPGPVDARVWAALDQIFGTRVRKLVRPVVTTTGDSAMAFYRMRDGAQAPAAPMKAALAEAPEPDELDRLFLG